MRHFDVGKLVNDKKLYSQWNEKYNLPEFDEDLVLDYLEPEIQKGGCIIDFHSSGVN
jgi:adenylate kinase